MSFSLVVRTPSDAPTPEPMAAPPSREEEPQPPPPDVEITDRVMADIVSMRELRDATMSAASALRHAEQTVVTLKHTLEEKVDEFNVLRKRVREQLGREAAELQRLAPPTPLDASHSLSATAPAAAPIRVERRRDEDAADVILKDGCISTDFDKAILTKVLSTLRSRSYAFAFKHFPGGTRDGSFHLRHAEAQLEPICLTDIVTTHRNGGYARLDEVWHDLQRVWTNVPAYTTAACLHLDAARLRESATDYFEQLRAGVSPSFAMLRHPFDKPRVLRALNQIKRVEGAWVFAKPVDPKVYPEYPIIIKRPMDIARIASGVERGTYGSIGAIHADVDQMWTNAHLYNPPDSPVASSAKRAKSLADQLFFDLECDQATRRMARTPPSGA